MDSSSTPAGKAVSWYRPSAARISAVAFSAFVLVLGYSIYIDYCVTMPTYSAIAQIEITQPSDTHILDPMRAEMEIISGPDVLTPIVTDLQLDKAWAKRSKVPLDALPMLDALNYLHTILHLDNVRGTHILNITIVSPVPKEAADVANAVADRYASYRQVASDQAFTEKENIIKGEISEQTKVIAQLRAAQEVDKTQQRALDDMQLKLRQMKTDHQLAENPVRIIALADPPEYASSPNHSLNLMIALADAFAVALVVPALFELALWYLSRLAPPRDSQPHFPSPPAAVTSSDY